MEIPQTVRALAEVIGTENAVKLAAKVMPGKCDRMLSVPARAMDANHPIVQAIGFQAAKTLQDTFGGSRVALCTLRGWKRHRAASERRGRIMQALNDGSSVADVAMREGVKRQYVSRIKHTRRSSSGWTRRVRQARHDSFFNNENVLNTDSQQ